MRTSTAFGAFFTKRPAHPGPAEAPGHEHAEELAALRQALAAAHAELAAQQAQRAALVAAMPDAAVLATAAGQVLVLNQSCRALFGLALAADGSWPVGEDWAALVRARCADPSNGATEGATRPATGGGGAREELTLADGRVLERHRRALGGLGSEQLVSYRVVPQPAAPAADAALLQAEQRLAEQRDFYESILNALTVEVAVFDAERRYRFVNARCFSDPALRQWVIGKSDLEYCAHRQRPVELAQNRRQLFEHTAQARIAVSWEETLPSDSGPRQVLRQFAPVYGADGALRLMIGTGSDITGRRQVETKLVEQREFYEFVLNQMPCEVVVFDADFRYLFVNATSFEDRAARQWVIGKDNYDFCAQYNHPRALAETRVARLEQATRERRLVTFEETFAWPEGPRHMYRLVQPVFHPDGRLNVLVGYSLDITERVAGEQAMRHAKLAAESAVRARELFLANMSHEIRTPMNAVLGMSQLLAKTPLAPDQDSYRQAITASAEHLLVIINDILDLSKLEAGKMTLEQVGFAPAQLLAEVEQTLHYKAVEKGLSLTTQLAPAVPAVLLGDPYRIRQVLLNLAGNAIKFTDAGRVAIGCEYMPGAGTEVGTVTFRVADTGVGIEPAFVKDIFEEFSQEDSSVTRKFGGTGLGLSICRNLLALMGSDVQLESEKNHGTVAQFALCLPVGTPEDLAPNEALPPDSPVRDDLRHKEVLLVEDNRFNRQIAKTFLQHAQVRVTEAENGAVAVELAQHQHFDMILMDIQMPVMDGYAATALLRRQLGLGVPIVALTANAIAGEREKCLAAGMSDYLAKPFREDELLKVVGKWVLPASVPALVPASGPGAVPATEPPAAPGGERLYQTDELLTVGQGDLEFVAFMLDTFVESCEEAMRHFDQGLRDGDVALLKSTAHTLRPSLTHLRALHVLPPVEALDRWPGQFEAEALQPLVDSVLGLLRGVVDQIRLDQGK